MDNENKAQYIGQELIRLGFKTWFLYVFKLCEGRPFILEPIHDGLFQLFEDIYNGKVLRCNVNVPPRSAKTTIGKYFLVWCVINNPKSNIIYTSYSGFLLSTIAREIREILENPAFKMLYPQNYWYTEEESDAIDDFWFQYHKKECGKNKYSSDKIITYAGGTCLFASIGAQITGMGAGIRTSKKFSGFLVLDDANKPGDIHSETMRNKVLRYYEETLLSRLNNPYVPIINIQQRLHVNDLSGLLEEKYNFVTLRKPLLDENDVCQIPSQYTRERIEELKQNNYMFSAQYQQIPMILGGEVIKRDWFKYYTPDPNYVYKRLLITADTAMKVKEHNDFSCFIVGGVTQDNKLHILDMVHGKWEAPDLKQIALNLFNQYRYNPTTGVACSGLYVEDKASGIGLIQDLQREGVPIIGLKADKDKLTRVENGLSYVASGQVLLPYDEHTGFNKDLLNECEAFTRDDSHAHDDIVDTLFYMIQEALAKGNVSLLDYFME